mgnify:CR=1 FL=1
MGEQKGGGGGVLWGNKQSWQDTNDVVGGAVRGEKAVGGDLQCLAALHNGAVGFVHHDLGGALAQGALAQGDAGAVGADVAGEELRAAGGVLAGEDNDRLLGDAGDAGAVVVAAGAVPEVEHYLAAGEQAGGHGGRAAVTSGVGAQVYNPQRYILFQIPDGLQKGLGGGGAETEAVNNAGVSHPVISDDGDVYCPAGE